ncbi:hypothetical protein [Fusobacterium sp. THCT1E2]
MALWRTNQEDLTKKTGTKEKITVSGVYEVEINEAYLTDSTKSNAKGVTLNFSNDESYGWFSLWYLKGDGQPNESAEKSLNRLIYLAKLKVDKLKQETKKVKLFSGNETDRTFLPELHGKKVGMILEVKKEGDNYNINLKDFYDIGTGKTTDEILNKTEATTVAFFKERFAKEEPKQGKKGYSLPYETDKNIITEDNEEEFPF